MKQPSLNDRRRELNANMHRRYMERTHDNSEHNAKVAEILENLRYLNKSSVETIEALKKVAAMNVGKMNPSISANFRGKLELMKFLATLPDDVEIIGDFSTMSDGGEFGLIGAKYYVNTNICEIKF